MIPFRPPNFEPMLATMMPFSKRYGVVGTFLFGFLGIVFFDAVTSGWGSWTWITALCYGALGVAAHLLGTVVFAALLSPALYRWVVQNEVFELKVSSNGYQVSNK
ncbi:MAG TPA: hypothetical protein VJH91_01435 [Candidatus Paceibacterota bacterium]